LTKLLAGHLHEAFEHYRQALAIYDPNGHGGIRFQYASDQGAIARAPLAWSEAIAGKTRSSFQNAKKAIGLASRLRHPHTTAHVTCVLAARAQTLGDLNTAAALAHAGKTLGEQFEFPYWSAWADLILGVGERQAGLSRRHRSHRECDGGLPEDRRKATRAYYSPTRRLRPGSRSARSMQRTKVGIWANSMDFISRRLSCSMRKREPGSVLERRVGICGH
jgi:hypothetical protein